MVLTLEEWIGLLKPPANRDDTLPSEALWIEARPHPRPKTKFEKPVQTVDDRTTDGHTRFQVQLKPLGALLGVETFP